MQKASGYIAVLRFTEAAGPSYGGLMTMHRFEDKEEFDAWMRRRNRLGRSANVREVVEHGISEERALELCRESAMERLQRTSAALGAARRETKRSNLLMDRFSADPRIVAIRTWPHQSRP
jgi:hypothetical protein